MPAVLIAPESPGLVLEPCAEAPAKARRYLTRRFDELGLDDDFFARLVVSELVTNACKHVKVGRIVVRIFADAQEPLIVIEVADEGTGLPVVKGRDDKSEHGRGLLLTAQLAHDWGVRPLDGKGKVVWARFAR